MSTVVLIHPGCTDFDEQNRIQGTLDVPLNERGVAQVQAVVEELRETPPEVIFTTPCEPARCTAETIGRELGVPVKEIDTLKNVNQGLWQGLGVDELRRMHPKVFKQWQESPENICAPDGETVADAMQRVRKAMAKITKRKDRIAVVAPEPLAALIRWHVCGGKLESQTPIESCTEKPRWELLQSDAGAAPGSNGSTSTDQAATTS